LTQQLIVDLILSWQTLLINSQFLGEVAEELAAENREGLEEGEAEEGTCQKREEKPGDGEEGEAKEVEAVKTRHGGEMLVKMVKRMNHKWVVIVSAQKVKLEV
jgi:hypothetical protein